MQTKRVELPGSHRKPAIGIYLGPSDPNETFKVTLALRSKGSDDDRRNLLSQIALRQRKPLTKSEFEDLFSARTADIKRIHRFAHQSGLAIEANVSPRHVTLVGTTSAFERAFSIELSNRRHESGVIHRARIGAIKVPAGLANCITGIYGLDNRPQLRSRMRIAHKVDLSPTATAKSISYTGNEVANIYQFPEADGSGQCFALIELGGGYTTQSIESYFNNLGITPPNVVAVSVDGATNRPGNPNGADGEVMLDILVAGAIAPAATILVVFAPNSDSGFLNAITTAMQHPRKPTGCHFQKISSMDFKSTLQWT